MTKGLRFVLVLVAMLGILSATALAAPPADLNALAAYYPDKTPVFISFRTDDAFIETLDALLQRVNSAIPDANIPPLFDALDESIADSGLFEDGDFQSVVRSWMGDFASVGIISLDTAFDDDRSNDDETPFLFAFQSTDRAAAEDFWDTTLLRNPNNNGNERSTVGDYTVYMSEDAHPGAGVVAVGDDVVFVANLPEVLPLNGMGGLGSNELFTSTLALLPEPDYNVTGFVNMGGAFRKVFDMPEMRRQPGMALFQDLFNSFPAQAFGATILDDRSLTLDFVQPYGDMMEQMQAMGFDVTMVGPIDPALAERIPSGTPLVLHSTGLAQSYRQAMRAMEMQMNMMEGDDAEAARAELERGLSQVRVAVRAATGLDLDEQLIPALDGDYIFYLGLNAGLADATSMMDLMKQFPVEFGIVLEVSDPAVIDGLVNGLVETIKAIPVDDDVTIEVNEDSIGGNTVQVVSITSGDMPFPVEIVLGGDGEVFFLGTPAAARASLNPDGGLPTDPQYVEATGYMLSNPSAVLYLASAGLQPLVGVVEAASGSSGAASSQAFAGALSLLSSSSISMTYEGDVSMGRAVWTLPE
ncbi:MAG: DUF3352 domain-containing protein [Anaerolineae bacterium]|nr:DUF3352 domain-containing protein [Anaerolineae bacterium]